MPASSPDDVVFASLPLAVIAYCATLGLDPREMIEVSGLTSDELRDPDALVDYESLIRLWEVLLARFPERPLGLDYASYITPTTLGVLGYACAHAKDLGAAVELYARHCRLADPRLVLTIERGDDVARITFSHEPRVEAMAEPIEMMVAALAFTSRRMNPSSPPPHEVCFRHPRRHPLARYEQIFEAPVRFSAGFTGVALSTASLSLPIMGADPRVGRYLQQQVEALQATREPVPAGAPLDARVRETIDEGLVTGASDQAAVARSLGMSSRSLQRGLQNLGTSFSEQLDAVRRERSLLLLRDPERSVREIAFMLGYADPRAFYRAFRRWTGHTPAEHRRPSR
ncbi:AraC family transcriptional regulator [Paraliomyxa miuraensis]|uniref:AraC family transcriptional regulator n=1 Tax=Paraliomyxa miuraensis TaxID=376150 RepID=UPI00224DE494|nr:AraC family transcriptional regulator [Paraliomyxa miuraensis]MCX4241686.1 AraC family transcriptional regulator [Paraliomyxa miuraensis]